MTADHSPCAPREVDDEMDIIRLQPSEGSRLRSMRLRALSDAPEAFGSTFEETAQRPAASWRQQLESLPTFFAVREGEDVGMVRHEPVVEDTGDAWLISLWVALGARGHGLGEALVSAVVESARQAGAGRVLLEVEHGNAAAIALYERLGFVTTGGRRRQAPPREHLIEVEYQLTL